MSSYYQTGIIISVASLSGAQTLIAASVVGAYPSIFEPLEIDVPVPVDATPRTVLTSEEDNVASDFIELSSLSRYKDTPAYNEGGLPEFCLFEAPDEFVDPADGYRTHHVSQSEVGFLDVVCVRYYGFGYEHLWWSVALVNGIIDPESEMYPGMSLVIPPKNLIVQFASRRGDAA